MMTFVVLCLIALASGIVGALVGLGGGVVLVPATIFYGITLGFMPEMTPQKVVGLSVVMMVFTGLSSTISYMKSKLVDFKAGWIFFIGSIPGAILGANLNKAFDLSSFQLFFGFLLIFLGTLLLIRDKLKPVTWFVLHGKKTTYIDVNGQHFEYGYPISVAIVLSFIVGTISGLFGIGGGSMIVPAMVVLFLFPPHVAVATSMFLVFLTSLVNSASHIYLGNVEWAYVLPIVIGAYIGAKIGAAINKKIQSDKVVIALRIVLLLMGVRSVMESFMQ